MKMPGKIGEKTFTLQKCREKSGRMATRLQAQKQVFFVFYVNVSSEQKLMIIKRL
jgi:hypothetical protein